MRTIGMTAGWKVSRAFPTVVYIDAPRKRSNFGHGCRSCSVFAQIYGFIFFTLHTADSAKLVPLDAYV